MSRPKERAGNTIMVLLLLLMFAVIALLLAMLGARVYARIVQNMDNSYALRASLSYVTGKVHAADCDAVSVRQFEGADVLCLRENIEGSRYITYIYIRDGQLMELFTDASLPFTAEGGEPIVPLSAFSVSYDTLLHITVSSDKGEQTCAIALRSGGVA